MRPENSVLGLIVFAAAAAFANPEITVELPGGTTMDFVWIEPGTFVMGSPESEPRRGSDEGPQHEVTISAGFYLGKYEITQGQWETVMETTPWSGRDGVRSNLNHPAAYLPWEGVTEWLLFFRDGMQEFIQRLNEAAGETLYRLPTEAEWEYACRAGTTTRWSFGDDESQLGDYAWFKANTWNVGEPYAHEVGSKLPNLWGLFDMHGNAWEWVQDGMRGRSHVIRGGGIGDFAWWTRSAVSLTYGPGRNLGFGARLLRMGPSPRQ